MQWLLCVYVVYAWKMYSYFLSRSLARCYVLGEGPGGILCSWLYTIFICLGQCKDLVSHMVYRSDCKEGTKNHSLALHTGELHWCWYSHLQYIFQWLSIVIFIAKTMRFGVYSICVESGLNKYKNRTSISLHSISFATVIFLELFPQLDVERSCLCSPL